MGNEKINKKWYELADNASDDIKALVQLIFISHKIYEDIGVSIMTSFNELLENMEGYEEWKQKIINDGGVCDSENRSYYNIVKLTEYALIHLNFNPVRMLLDSIVDIPGIAKYCLMAVQSYDLTSWVEAEKIICKDACVSVKYAKDVIKGRWEPGEESISEDAYESYRYADLVINGRWPMGEDTIRKDAHASRMYAQYVIDGLWKPGEDAISKDTRESYFYAKYVICGKWPMGEDAIRKDFDIWHEYLLL